MGFGGHRQPGRPYAILIEAHNPDMTTIYSSVFTVTTVVVTPTSYFSLSLSDRHEYIHIISSSFPLEVTVGLPGRFLVS